MGPIRCVLLLLAAGTLMASASNNNKQSKEKPEHVETAWNFLEQFGYVSASEHASKSEEALRRGLEHMKALAGLDSSDDVVDNATIAKMSMPRCGVPDVAGYESNRDKRYALFGRKWSKLSLTYSINNGPNTTSPTTPILSSASVRSILAAAYKQWTDVTPLVISPQPGASADMQIGFYSYSHGDGADFDGPRKVLAHAFYPPTGWIHFDDSESWTDATFQGINLLQVAIHEFGHALGLAHSNVTSAIMYPYYGGYVSNFTLHADDIAGIQALYGARMFSTATVKTTKPVVTTTVKPTTRPVVTTTIKPTTRPVVTTTVKPTTRPVVTTTIKPTTRPVVTTTVKPTTRPVMTTTMRPTTRFITSPTTTSRISTCRIVTA